MYLRTEYNDLRKLAKFVGRVSKTGFDPATLSVLLETTPEGLEASTMTPEGRAWAFIPGEVENHGSVAVNGALLSERVSALVSKPEDIIEVSESDDCLAVQAGKVSFEIRLTPISSANVIPYPELEGHVKVKPDFCEWLKLAEFASSSDLGRGALCGVQVSDHGLAATDSYRFILINEPIEGLTQTVISKDFIKLFPDPDTYGDGDLLLYTSENEVELVFGQQRIAFPSLMGDYPAVEKLLDICPGENTPYQFELEVKELKEALTSAAPYYSSTTGATLHPDGNLRIITQEGEQYRMKLETATVALPTPVTFNMSFLKNVEKLVRDADTCVFMFNEERPAAMPFTVTKDNVIIGIMPQRLV